MRRTSIDFDDPWDFEDVYGALHDFARGYPFKPDDEDYLVHITTGTHVAQICLFLLTESRYFPARLLQTAPPQRRRAGDAGALTHRSISTSRSTTGSPRASAREQREGAVVPQVAASTRATRASTG